MSVAPNQCAEKSIHPASRNTLCAGIKRAAAAEATAASVEVAAAG